MNERKKYIGIDFFRVLAAFFIIMIHTSPLLSYSETGDFVLTRVTARVAVPFFFMTSGFFLISRYSKNAEKLKKFIKKIVLIYVISILIYLPINFYKSYFSADNLLSVILKNIFFDGTMYHLWYLPASIIGAIIGWFLVKKFCFTKSLIITGVLYLIGLFGDSYYGISQKVPVIKNIYNTLFKVFDYTRNGIFFAPIFFVLGGIIAEKTFKAWDRISEKTSDKVLLKKNLVGLGVSFCLLLGEGLVLHKLGLQRHDSMYLMLLPCMFFLFSSLTFFNGKRELKLRKWALVMYVIHPFVIAVLPKLVNVSGMNRVIIENSLLHFLVVSFISSVVSILVVFILKIIVMRVKKDKVKEKNEDGDLNLYKKVNQFDEKYCRAWIEINLHHLRNNVMILKKEMQKDCDLMAIVKANAYGHGSFEISTSLEQCGVKAFAVATIDEGIELRKYGIRGEILILGYTDPNLANKLYKYKLTQTLIHYEYAKCLNAQGFLLKVHIKIDTGMHRLGFDVNDNEKVIKAFQLHYLKISGIFTHLAVSESLADEDVAFTKFQIGNFYKLLHYISFQGITLPKTHIQSSFGLLHYPDLKCDFARIGLGIYGILNSNSKDATYKFKLRPVLSLRSQIVLLRKVIKGESVGYDKKFVSERDSWIGMVPIGYADGVPRNLSCGKGEVIVNGVKAPIVGGICMDQLFVDVTEVIGVSIGDIVTLIGKDGKEEILALEVAKKSDSIVNELLSRLGGRLRI